MLTRPLPALKTPGLWRVLRALTCAVSLSALVPAHAQPTSDDRGTLLVMFENDLFADQDQQYTNGVKLGWISPDLTRYRDSDALPRWLLPVVQRLPLINEPGVERNVELYLGQKIFTPQDTASRTLVRDDRPYAGWLYLGAGFHNKTEHFLDAFHLQVGVTGPPSLARQAQRFVHDVRGLNDVNGWDNQLKFEPGFVAYAERKQRVLAFGAAAARGAKGFGGDAIVHLGAALGNVYTYGATGGELRFGYGIPRDFGLSLIRPGGDSNAPSQAGSASYGEGFGAWGFVALSGRVVGRDLFLDGNTFRDSHRVDKRHLVGDAIVGFALRWDDIKLSYAQVFRSPEFDPRGRGHEFGSLSLSFAF